MIWQKFAALFRKPDPPKAWAVVEWANDHGVLHELHILPTNDQITHELPSDCCPCGARWELHDGINVYTHHSLDGREQHE